MKIFPRLALLACAGPMAALACGPFFPDTVLDLPQAALRVRATCFIDEMIAIDRSQGSRLSLRTTAAATFERLQNPQLQVDDLAPVIAAGMPDEVARKADFSEGQTRSEAVEIAVLLLDSGVVLARVEVVVDAFVKWRSALPFADFAGPCAVAIPQVSAVPAPPEVPELPADVRNYWAAARLFRGGDLAAAREGWQGILTMPAAENRQRAVWAAWMLAKTSPDPGSARPFYQKCVELAEHGCADALGLAPLALGWLAWNEPDPVAALKLYFSAGCHGHVEMFTSLRWRLPRLFEHDGEALARAAADPLAREIVTAMLFSMDHGPESSGLAPENDRTAMWLGCLEKSQPGQTSSAAAKAAWMCYSRGDFAAAKRWLAQSPPDSGEVVWLRAKLALRDGQLDHAARLFAKAAPLYQIADNRETAYPIYAELTWYEHQGRHDWLRGQFHTDRAIVHIARGEFLRAMDFLAKAGYHDDAAYLAERVLTTDELVSWIRKNRPAHPALAADQLFVMGEDGVQRAPGGEWVGDRMRYLLARRLAREFRFREAVAYMPAALKPHFEHYVKLHRAARSGSWPDETRAAILWHLASLRRHLGMEFFGYEGAPDNTLWDGAFVGLDFGARRSLATGWHFEWNESGQIVQPAVEPADFAVPRISREELLRLATYLQPGQPRYHYRYDAAEIAWRAAALLPDNDPAMLYMLHEAGRWLAMRDPQAADRFYQEIIRRCENLPEWQELDRRRWFLPKSPSSALPELPAALRFNEPGVAGAGVFHHLAVW